MIYPHFSVRAQDKVRCGQPAARSVTRRRFDPDSRYYYETKYACDGHEQHAEEALDARYCSDVEVKFLETPAGHLARLREEATEAVGCALCEVGLEAACDLAYKISRLLPGTGTRYGLESAIEEAEAFLEEQAEAEADARAKDAAAGGEG